MEVECKAESTEKVAGMQTNPPFFAVVGARAIKSVRVAIRGIDPEYTIGPRWQEDGRIVHHIETAVDLEPGTILELDPRAARVKEVKSDIFVVMLDLPTLKGAHLTVGLHATRARAEEQVERLARKAAGRVN